MKIRSKLKIFSPRARARPKRSENPSIKGLLVRSGLEGVDIRKHRVISGMFRTNLACGVAGADSRTIALWLRSPVPYNHRCDRPAFTSTHCGDSPESNHGNRPGPRHLVPNAHETDPSRFGSYIGLFYTAAIIGILSFAVFFDAGVEGPFRPAPERDDAHRSGRPPGCASIRGKVGDTSGANLAHRRRLEVRGPVRAG